MAFCYSSSTWNTWGNGRFIHLDWARFIMFRVIRCQRKLIAIRICTEMKIDVEGKHKCNVKVRSSLLFRPLILYSIFKFLKIYSIFTTFLWMDMWLIESKFAHKNFCRSIIFYLITLACLVKRGSHICNDRFLLFSVFQTFPVDKGSIVTKNY